jgi:hypothetical protein
VLGIEPVGLLGPVCDRSLDLERVALAELPHGVEVVPAERAGVGDKFLLLLLGGEPEEGGTTSSSDAPSPCSKASTILLTAQIFALVQSSAIETPRASANTATVPTLGLRSARSIPPM